MSIDELITLLNEFVPFPTDDPVNSTEAFLHDLMEEWKQLPDKEKAIPVIFHLLEKYPHADFGSPGPLVHALESLRTGYQGPLQASLLRKPTPMTLWMYNRIINAESDPGIRKAHLSRLRLFEKHPLADEATRKEAASFIQFQDSQL